MQLALQDRQYVDRLREIGERERLMDAANFQRNAMELLIGNNTSELLKEIAWRKEEGAKSRKFKEDNLIEDLESADRLLQAQIDDGLEADIISGVAGIASAGIKYKYNKKPSTWESSSGQGSIGSGGVQFPSKNLEDYNG